MHAARAFTFYDGSAQQKHRGKRQGSENEAELVNEREREERREGEGKEKECATRRLLDSRAEEDVAGPTEVFPFNHDGEAKT